MRYTIVYTNDRTVQGQRVYWSVSKVSIFSQGKVQGLTPTYPMQMLTVELYHRVVFLFVFPRRWSIFIHVGDCWKKWVFNHFKEPF